MEVANIEPSSKKARKKATSLENGSIMRSMVSPNVILEPCNRFAFTHFQKRFKFCLRASVTDSEKTIILNAFVLDNNLCLLVFPSPLTVMSLTYDVQFLESTDGNIKKPSVNLSALDTIATVSTPDGQSIELKSPIQGKLLEINSSIRNQITSPQLMQESTYVAVLQSYVPEIVERCGISVLSMQSNFSIEQLCYSWIKGNCARGDQCKYLHPPILNK
jgi:hypothetical protein